MQLTSVLLTVIVVSTATPAFAGDLACQPTRIAGEPKSYKSLLSLDLALSVASLRDGMEVELWSPELGLGDG